MGGETRSIEADGSKPPRLSSAAAGSCSGISGDALVSDEVESDGLRRWKR
jgi:hypothetical protein